MTVETKLTIFFCGCKVTAEGKKLLHEPCTPQRNCKVSRIIAQQLKKVKPC